MAATASLCEFGWKALDARLLGVDGHHHSLLERTGRRGLVIAFICNHCPYVRAVIGRIVRDAHDLKNFGVNFVAINSNDASAYSADSYEKMKDFAQEFGLPFPYLHDPEQIVANSYGAVCTPDFFGFNASGELQYRGRLDASRKETGPADLRRDLYEAMVQIANSGHGPQEQISAIGCSIKWRTPA